MPNAYSVVNWLSIGKWNILLGGDLENSSDSDRGWNSILFSREKPAGKATIIKVPHHGSRNAPNSLGWNEMLQAPVLALLTPFFHGGKEIPNGNDINRICALSNKSYCACEVEPIQPKRRSNSVNSQLSKMSRERKVVGGKFGQIRVRFNPLDRNEYELALIDQAIPLFFP